MKRMTRRRHQVRGEEDKSKEDKGKDDRAETEEIKSTKYKRICQCDRRISELDFGRPGRRKNYHDGQSTFNLGIFMDSFGMELLFSDFADRICLVEIREVERLERFREIYDNRDPQLLTRLVMKHLDWFEPEDKLWLFRDEQGLTTDLIEFSGG